MSSSDSQAGLVPCNSVFGLDEPVSIALQGGGSLGAFTWGVLDRLLEDGRLRIDTVSGASAGAINAAMLAQGVLADGAVGGRERLERFWRRASGASPSATVRDALAISTRMLSPYQFNPFDLNPLRQLLAAELDFDKLRTSPPFGLLVGATRVRDGALRLFDSQDLTLDALLASACLPLVHQAVAIDGEDHWDGGYAANPPLLPLVEASRTRNILVVRIVPTHGRAHARRVPEIARRLDQMTFNASLMRDLETLGLLRRLGGDHAFARANIAIISAEDVLPHLDEIDALDLDWSALQMLRDAGRAAAEAWVTRTGSQGGSQERLSPSDHRASSPLRYVG